MHNLAFNSAALENVGGSLSMIGTATRHLKSNSEFNVNTIAYCVHCELTIRHQQTLLLFATFAETHLFGLPSRFAQFVTVLSLFPLSNTLVSIVLNFQ